MVRLSWELQQRASLAACWKLSERGIHPCPITGHSHLLLPKELIMGQGHQEIREETRQLSAVYLNRVCRCLTG